MSDSFADLWNSAGSSKPAEPPRTLGSLSTGPLNTLKPQKNDVFSMLAATNSSSSLGSRNGPSSQRGPSPATSASTTQVPAAQRTMQKAVSTGSDAFGDLLSGTFASSSSGAHLTMAERAARAERERKDKQQQQQKLAQQQASAWAGLDSLDVQKSIAAPTSSKLADPDDDWIFDSQPAKVPVPTPAASTKTSAQNDDWSFDDFASPPPVTRTQSLPQQSNSLLGLNEFESNPVSHQSRHSPQSPSPRSNTPGDFDFGDREDALLDDDSNDEDDILGALSKPAGKLVGFPADFYLIHNSERKWNFSESFCSGLAHTQCTLRTRITCRITSAAYIRPDCRNGVLYSRGSYRISVNRYRVGCTSCFGDTSLKRRW